jgi:hypothetical protein
MLLKAIQFCQCSHQTINYCVSSSPDKAGQKLELSIVVYRDGKLTNRQYMQRESTTDIAARPTLLSVSLRYVRLQPPPEMINDITQKVFSFANVVMMARLPVGLANSPSAR